jgi:3'-phosphoadenosine 5'-phosphosulfate sulfotransferase (PAPS reductase)/FAD synthetase
MFEVAQLASKPVAQFCQSLNGFDIEDEPDMIHVIPCSGGADSSALAVFLHKAFPHISFRLMLTDTGAEPASMWEFLKKVEEATGNTVEIVRGELNLFELVDSYSGFIPGPGARFCTRELKLKPFQSWMKQFEGKPLTMYVGIRADEAKRVAFDIPGVETIMPFVEMGWNRSDVFGYLSKTVGVPRTYLGRTRSGCTVCPFTRRSEAVFLYQESPIEFHRGMKYEKLTDADQQRYPAGVPLWKDTGLGLNWLSLPLPETGDAMEGSRARKEDLFGQRGLFAAGEFFMDSMPGMTPFVYQQRFISYSPSLRGIQQQINARYEHLLQTAEVHDLEPDEVRQQVRFAIWYVELPAEDFDTEGPRGKSYTWQQGTSYKQIQHTVDLLTRALHAEDLRKRASKPIRESMTVEYEWALADSSAMAQAQASGRSLGHVVDSMWFTPVENVQPQSDDEETISAPCPMCSI